VRESRQEIDLDRLAVESEDAPVVKIVNLILVQALKEKASDIHIEPFEKQLKLATGLMAISSRPVHLRRAFSFRSPLA
jgi:type II secretory ATPase GspE/PulE/Tfp pilus assembly ATPase PilB-like protein